VARLREERLQSYLQRHELTGAPILGLGASELHHLQGNGICSAADVSAAALAQRPEPYGRSPQVTPALAAALLAWRAQLEAVFTCNPEHSATRDFRDLEEQQRQRRQGHEQALRTGAAELRRLRGDILAGRRELLPAFSTLHRRLAQARADLERL